MLSVVGRRSRRLFYWAIKAFANAEESSRVDIISPTDFGAVVVGVAFVISLLLCALSVVAARSRLPGCLAVLCGSSPVVCAALRLSTIGNPSNQEGNARGHPRAQTFRFREWARRKREDATRNYSGRILSIEIMCSPTMLQARPPAFFWLFSLPFDV